LLGHRRASSAQPVFRRSWTQPFYPTPNSNPFSTGTSFANQDFSGYDWTSINIPVTIPSNGTVERDDSPLPEVELEFNGFSFGDGAVDATHSLSINTLSTSVSSSSISSASSVSSRHSPWLEGGSNQDHHHHSRSLSQHCSSLSIAPHDLPPLDVSSDINWSAQVTALSASSTTPLSSTSSSAAAPAENTHANSKPVSNITPNQAMFDLGLVDYEFAMDMNGGGGGIDYAGYEYGNMSIEYGGYDISTATSDMGMGLGVPADAMWNRVKLNKLDDHDYDE